MERKCVNCFYSKPAMNKDLVVCTYMDDILSHGNILDSKEEWSSAKYFTKLTNFSGDAFEAYSEENGEKVLRVCVSKDASCGKFAKGRND